MFCLESIGDYVTTVGKGIARKYKCNFLLCRISPYYRATIIDQGFFFKGLLLSIAARR
jgi:hypothetical protein